MEFNPPVDCSSNDYINSTFCLIHSDWQNGSNISSIIMLIPFSFLLAKTIWNLILISKIQSNVSKHMKIINILVFIFIVLEITLLGEAFPVRFDHYGIPSFIVFIILSISVLILSTSLTLAAYFWFSTIFTATFNNSRLPLLKVVCCFLISINVLGALVIIIFSVINPVSEKETNNTFQNFYYDASYGIAISTALNGIYFIYGCFILFNNIDDESFGVKSTIKSVTKSLILMTGLFTILRIFNDLIQPIMKYTPFQNHQYSFGIYLFIYQLTTNALPTYILLSRFAPTHERYKLRSDKSLRLSMAYQET